MSESPTGTGEHERPAARIPVLRRISVRVRVVLLVGAAVLVIASVLAVALRRLDALGGLRSGSVGPLVAVAGVGTLLLVVFAIAVERSIVKPVRLVGRSMRRFGDGDLSARSTEAPDELGTLARSFNVMADALSDRLHQLNAVAERGTRLRMISDALDLADRETDVYRILDRAFGLLTPDLPAELLLNDLTSTKLWRVAANPSAGPAGCPVENTEGCVAMRRGQPVVFESPTAINACPQLRNHATPCSAACVPVSVSGQLLGVMHITAAEHEVPAPEVVEQLVTLSGQIGARFGAMRTLETSRLEASTDGLTGLANRRMLEARLGELVRSRLPFALAVADLDRFKQLNDNFGHEIGDRALQVFSKVLHDNVRGHDLVARYGGEEFVLVFPDLSVAKSMEVLERIRAALANAIEINGLPPFSSSFGVTHSSSADSVDGVIRIADAGLLMAKDLGRNRVVFADQDVALEVFGSPRAEAAEAAEAESD